MKLLNESRTNGSINQEEEKMTSKSKVSGTINQEEEDKSSESSSSSSDDGAENERTEKLLKSIGTAEFEFKTTMTLSYVNDLR